MPVFGLLKDQRAGTYLLRPPSVVSAGGYRIGKLKDGNCAANSCGDSRVSHHGDVIDNFKTTKVKSDPNILIAAYGTQITLRKCRPGSAGDDDLHKETYSDGKYSPRAKNTIRVPTAHVSRGISSQSHRTSSKFRKELLIKSPVYRSQTMQRARTQFTNSCLLEEEKKKNLTEISETFRSKSSPSITLAYTSEDLQQTSTVQASFSSQDTTDSCEETVDLLHYNSTMNSPRGDYKRTAWHVSKPEVSPSAVLSVANCVDFNDVAQIVASSYSRMCLQTPQAPAPSAVDETEMKTRNSSVDSSVTDVDFKMRVRIPNPDVSMEGELHSGDISEEVRRRDNAGINRLHENEFGRYISKGDDPRGTKSLLLNYVNRMKVISKLQAFRFPNQSGKNEAANCKIEEVWGARNRTAALRNVDFSHENLRRPSSAIQVTNSYRIPSSRTNGIPTDVFSHACSDPKGFDVKRRSRSGKKRKKIQRKRRTSASNATECNSHSLQSSSLTLLEGETSSGVLDSKSLIRQNHRPTTAIRYCKQDAGTKNSITPCLRKAVVSHSVYVTMHKPQDKVKPSQMVSESRSPDQPDFTLHVSSQKLRTNRDNGCSDKTANFMEKSVELKTDVKEIAAMEVDKSSKDSNPGNNEIEKSSILHDTTENDVAARSQAMAVKNSTEEFYELPDKEELQSRQTELKISINAKIDDNRKRFSYANNTERELKNDIIKEIIADTAVPNIKVTEETNARTAAEKTIPVDKSKTFNQEKNRSDAMSRPIIPRIAPLSKFRLRRFECRSSNQENSNCFKMMKDRMIRKWLIKVEDARSNSEFITDEMLS